MMTSCDDFMPPQSSFGGIKIKALGLVVSDKIFSCFPCTCICLCKTCDPRTGPFLAPGAYFEQTLKRSTR